MSSWAFWFICPPSFASFSKQWREEEVLHSVERGGVVEAALVIILAAEYIFCSAWRWDGQRFRRRSLMDFWCDCDPSLMGLVDGRKQRRAWYLRCNRRKQPWSGIQEERGARWKVEHGVQRKVLRKSEDHRQFVVAPRGGDRMYHSSHTLIPIVGLSGARREHSILQKKGWYPGRPCSKKWALRASSCRWRQSWWRMESNSFSACEVISKYKYSSQLAIYLRRSTSLGWMARVNTRSLLSTRMSPCSLVSIMGKRNMSSTLVAITNRPHWLIGLKCWIPIFSPISELTMVQLAVDLGMRRGRKGWRGVGGQGIP